MHALLLAALTIRALALPPHATIEPFGTSALVVAGRSGALAATVSVDGYRQQVVAWNARGGYRIVATNGTVAGFDADGTLLVNDLPPQRIAAFGPSTVDLRSCENFPQDSIGPVLAGALSNGSLILTMQSPAIVDLDDASGQKAPVVLYLRSGLCSNLGNGVALATAGLYAAGYVAFINNVPAPSNVVSSKERFDAMRWHERMRERLGPGAALAVNAAGNAAGADLPPGGVAYNAQPHARAWIGESLLELAPDAPLSVAYAIDDRDRITGMLEDATHHHYAFLWDRGRLRRLDDLAAGSGWRMECGYAFLPDGSIVGIGTYRGRATAFRLQGL
jgi:hypothetical protein